MLSGVTIKLKTIETITNKLINARTFPIELFGLKELRWKRMNKGLNIKVKRVIASLTSYYDSDSESETSYGIDYKVILNVGNPSPTINIIMDAKVESKRFGSTKIYRFEPRKIKERDNY